MAKPIGHEVRTQSAAPAKPHSFTPAWTSRISPRLWGLLLIAATLLAYWPALHGTLVWDDDSWTTNIVGLLRSVHGLRLIWCDPTALQQYYPLTATSFWLDYHLWGAWYLPYHVENVLLHAIAALLFWQLLRRLEVPGAWLAAALFALHPLMVESAGWITERKNVLSLVLYLGALLAYGRFTRFWREDDGIVPPRRWGNYALAFFLLLAALLAKTTAFSFPAVVLLICWWKRGRLRVWADVLPTLPFFAIAIGLSRVTAYLEKNHVGAQGPDWAISFPQRCLIAGRALWFYAGKMVWPAGLCFVYPRWKLDAASLTQWLYPLAALAVFLGLWFARKRIGRGPLTAVLFYAGTLFPVLGFLNAYFMRYSFVSDHWAYLSSLGLFALAAGLITQLAARFRTPALPYIFAAIVLPMLVLLTSRQSRMYVDMETLWRTTIARNPDGTMAHNNLGIELAAEGKVDEAISHFKWNIETTPDDSEAHYNLGNALAAQGKLDEAIQCYERALRINPNYADAQNNLGVALSGQGRLDEAIQQLERVIQLNPDYAQAHFNLANTLAAQGKLDEAAQHYERALQLNPNYPEAHYNLGNAFGEQGRWEESIRQYEQALRLKPDYPEAEFNIGNLLVAGGKGGEAMPYFQKALSMAVQTNQAALADAIRGRIKLLQPTPSEHP